MITVVIVGVISAIALPMYVNYIAQAQVSRVHGEISNYKRAIEGKLLQNDIANIPTNPQDELGYTDSNLSTVVFGTFIDEPNSTITATMDGETYSGIRGTGIQLKRQMDGSWICTVTGVGGGWSDRFKPANCL